MHHCFYLRCPYNVPLCEAKNSNGLSLNFVTSRDILKNITISMRNKTLQCYMCFKFGKVEGAGGIFLVFFIFSLRNSGWKSRPHPHRNSKLLCSRITNIIWSLDIYARIMLDPPKNINCFN